MKIAYKIILGLFSVLPLTTLGLLAIKFFYIGDFFRAEGGISDSTLVYLKLNLAGMYVSVFMIIIYIVHLLRDKRLPKDRKSLWMVLLICLNISCLPFYWYMRIWKD